MLSVTIVTLIWRFVLAPDAGLLGETAQALGAEPIPFLSHPTWSLWALAITTIWWSIGLPMMLFLAGLQQIPGDIYEAAALDRASRWTTFWRVTLPSLRRTVVLVVMLQTAAQLQIFGQAQLLTGGGPGGATADDGAVHVRESPSAGGSWAMRRPRRRSCSCSSCWSRSPNMGRPCADRRARVAAEPEPQPLVAAGAGRDPAGGLRHARAAALDPPAVA